jgi:hypothetical protein
MSHVGIPEERERRFDEPPDGADLSAVGGRSGRDAVVGAKEFIGTIEQVDTHDNDPREDADREEALGDPWRQASEQFSVLGSKLRTRYREIVGDDGPAEEEVRQAFTTIGSAAQSLADSIGESMRDPEVRDQVKQATSTFFSAIGKTLSQLGDELRSTDERNDDR